jgi:hypothetical protein
MVNGCYKPPAPAGGRLVVGHDAPASCFAGTQGCALCERRRGGARAYERGHVSAGVTRSAADDSASKLRGASSKSGCSGGCPGAGFVRDGAHAEPAGLYRAGAGRDDSARSGQRAGRGPAGRYNDPRSGGDASLPRRQASLLKRPRLLPASPCPSASPRPCWSAWRTTRAS